MFLFLTTSLSSSSDRYSTQKKINLCGKTFSLYNYEKLSIKMIKNFQGLPGAGSLTLILAGLHVDIFET